MVASIPYERHSKDHYDRARAPETDMRAMEVNERTQLEMTSNTVWLREGALANRYYRSDQYRRGIRTQDRSRIRTVANFIRRDIDHMEAEVLDAELVAIPTGRHGKNHEFGRQLHQVADWTRDEEEDWGHVQEKAIEDCFHIGEGYQYEGWNPEGDEGRGMPEAEFVDARFLLFDSCAKKPQLDDAQYVIWLEHRSIEDVEAQYGLADVEPEGWESLLPARQQSTYHANRLRRENASNRRGAEKVWVKHQFEKKKKWEARYWLAEDGSAAQYQGEAITPEVYRELPEKIRKQLTKTTHPVEELWETIVVNSQTVKHELSIYDKSNGGHGHYPFARYYYVQLKDEARARGEIGFLVGVQDITNETISSYLTQLFLANVGYLHSYRGSIPPEEQEKIPRIGVDPLVTLETRYGMPPPEWRGLNPTGAQVHAQAMPTIREISDKVSGVQDVERGQIPGHIQSGRAIRALQAKASRLGTKTRRHIEDGMKRAMLLRLHNIMQFMRGNRLVEVTAPDKTEDKILLLGHDEMEIAAGNGLIPQPDPETGEMAWVTPEGKPAEILVLNDEVAREAIFKKIKLHLDTGRQANRLERKEEAEMVLNIAGRDALHWVAKEMEWNNPDELMEQVEQGDQGRQIMEQMQQIEQQTGLSIQEQLQLLQQSLQGDPQAA